MTQALPDRTVPDMLDERVAASPEATAFCCEQADGSWAPVSWHDFHAQAKRLAAGLLAQGLRKGDRLALIAPVSLEWERVMTSRTPSPSRSPRPSIAYAAES